MTTLRLFLALAAITACTRETPPAAPASPMSSPPVPVSAHVESAHTHADRHPEAVKEPDENVIAAMGMRVIFVDPGAEDPNPVDTAVVVMQPTRGSRVAGTITLRDVNGGLDVSANITGLPSTRHAFHVHVFGDCSSDDGKAAGPHFHFSGSAFHPTEKIITGDLGDLEAHRGVSTTQKRIVGASLQGKFSVLGRSVIIHEKPNDPSSTPDGAAGARLACGVIGVAPSPAGDELARY